MGLEAVNAIREEGFERSAAVLATFVHHAADRDELLPRKPLPQDDE